MLTIRHVTRSIRFLKHALLQGSCVLDAYRHNHDNDQAQTTPSCLFSMLGRCSLQACSPVIFDNYIRCKRFGRRWEYMFTPMTIRLGCFAWQISDRRERSVWVCHTVTWGHKAAEPVLLSISATVLAFRQRRAGPQINSRSENRSNHDRNDTGLQSCTMPEKPSA